MHVLEKAARTGARLSDQLWTSSKDEHLEVHLVNGTDRPLQAAGVPQPSAGECSVSFQTLEPGQAGIIRFWGTGGYGCGVEFAIDKERFFVGSFLSTLTGTRCFATEFPKSEARTAKQFADGMARVWWGSGPDVPDRACGQAYAATCMPCAAGACFTHDAAGGVAADAARQSMAVLVTAAAETGGGASPDRASLGPHLRLASMDCLQQIGFAEWLEQTELALLGPALFVSEHSGVARALVEARLIDQVFAMDLLIGAFLHPSAGALLGTGIAAALEHNVTQWRHERPAALSREGTPDYADYEAMPSDQEPHLQRYAAAARSLLCAAFFQSVIVLKAQADRCPHLGTFVSDCKLAEVGAGEEEPSGEQNTDSLFEHLLTTMAPTKSDEAPADSDEFLTKTVKTCIGDTARHSVRLRNLMRALQDMVPAEERDGIVKFMEWLPSARREFRRTPTKDQPGLRFCCFGAELFANLDGGKATNSKHLLESLGPEAPAYKSMTTNSKSGEFFFFSHDRRFLIKTVSDEEGQLLHRMLPAYQNHLRKTPDSFIVRYAGLLRAEVEGKFAKYFTIMVSVFDPSCKVSETFDVKGSLYHRKAKEGESVGKDQDWHSAGRRLELPSLLCREMLAVHEADAAFLAGFEVMDYSLLIGVHKLAGTAPGGSGRRVDGGFWSEKAPEVYYVGLIDFLIGYGLYKEAEHLVRSAQGHGHDASCVHPVDYAKRQVAFVRESVFAKEAQAVGTVGSLRIYNLEGHNLVNKDGFLDKSDPYVVAEVGLQRATTKVIKDDLNPKWDEELVLPLNREHRKEKLELFIWDKEDYRAIQGNDDTLGRVVIDIASLVAQSDLHFRQPVLGERHGELSGKILLDVPKLGL